MSTDSARDADALPVDRPVAPAAFLRQWASSPAAFATLAVGWAVLAIAGTQLPQADAPLTVTDGLSRPDLLAIQALGLHRLATSAAFWLLLALTVVAVVARLLFPESVAAWRRATLGSDELAPRLVRALSPVAAVRTKTLAGVTRIDVGAPVAGPALIVAAGLVLATLLVFFQTSGAPVLLDVPIDGAERALKAWSPDAGTFGVAAGRWRGRCSAAGDRISCALDVPGALPAFTVGPGESAAVAGMRFAWLATGRTADAGAPTLRWQPAGTDDAYAIRLQAGQMREAAALGGARFLDIPTRTAGPLVIVHSGPAAARSGAALASPALGLPGRSAATVQTTPIARLQVTADQPLWLLGLAAALALAGAWLAWLRPRLRVEIADGEVVVRSCNRAELLETVQSVATTAGDLAPARAG